MSEELFSGHGWKIRREKAILLNGKEIERVRAEYYDGVHIIAVRDDGKILTLREYRPFQGTWMWLLPSGHVDKETDHLAAANRELREETGFRAEEIRQLWSSNVSEPNLRSSNYFFLAQELSKDPLPQDEDENIEVHALAPEEAYAKIAGSERVHLASAYGLLRYLKELPK